MATGLADLAPSFGHHAFLAQVLFEVEGTWSANEPDPALRVHLARHSRYHLWHAELWIDLLPDSVRLADLVDANAPDPIWGEQLGALAELTGTGGRLAVLYRSVMPRLITATGRLLDRLSPLADGAAIRSGGFVGADLAREQAAGARLLHELVTGEDLATALSGAAATDVVLSGSDFGR